MPHRRRRPTGERDEWIGSGIEAKIADRIMTALDSPSGCTCICGCGSTWNAEICCTCARARMACANGEIMSEMRRSKRVEYKY